MASAAKGGQSEGPRWMLAAVSSHLKRPGAATTAMAAAALALAEWGSVRGVFVGSGSDGMGGAGVAEHGINLPLSLA